MSAQPRASSVERAEVVVRTLSATGFSIEIALEDDDELPWEMVATRSALVTNDEITEMDARDRTDVGD